MMKSGFKYYLSAIVLLLLSLPLLANGATRPSGLGKGDQKQFLIDGSETPRSIPSWLWALIILFMGWAAYYFIMHFSL